MASCHEFSLKIFFIAVSRTITPKRRLGNGTPVLAMKPKRGWYIVGLFLEIGQCSAISYISRRELSIDVAELMSMLENTEISATSVLGMCPKEVYSIPQFVFFLCCIGIAQLKFGFAGSGQVKLQ